MNTPKSDTNAEMYCMVLSDIATGMVVVAGREVVTNSEKSGISPRVSGIWINPPISERTARVIRGTFIRNPVLPVASECAFP